MSSETQNQRINFASIKNPMQYPDFLEVQLKSFQDFLQLDTPPEKRKNDGLYKVFAENFPIADTRNNFVLEFLDYYIDPPHYTIDDCLERGLTYSVPLKAKLKLYCTDPDHEDFDTVIQDVYLGPIPYMTPKGTFVINGAERVVVSQLHRSPGVFFGQSIHANGTKLYSARIIPFKGSWIEFATDINNVMYAYIDRKKKLPVTTLLRAVGFENDKDILEIFNLAEDVKVNKTNLKKIIGRKLAARVLKTWTEDFVDEDTGEVVSIERNEVVIDRETVIEPEHIDLIIESGVQNILVHNEEANASDYSIIFNTLQKDPSNSEKEAVLYIYRQLRNADPADDASAREVINNLFFSEKRYDLGDVGRYRINKKLNLDTPMDVRVLTKQDIIEIIKYLIELINSKADVDDIDHLSNRRVRTVGEQLSNQFAIGLARMSRTIRERMNVRDNEVFTPIDLINAKTISSVINSFFGTNALSQFMDQTNPLAEITHKRRLSALGPGGLSRDRAGFEVRDVHYTHYGRLCPIETPEGPNIGLISSLCVYAKINELGFIVTPYRKVKNGVVDLSNEGIEYLSAEEEEDKIIAQGNAPLNDDGTFIRDKVKARRDADYPVVTPDQVELMDVAPQQIASIAASLIPFLEHDDANRALMGSNMMRQAVPLLKTEAPIVGTGIEKQLCEDSRTQIAAEGDGVVDFVDATTIRILYDRTEDEEFVSFEPALKEYRIPKFRKTNQSMTIDLRPICNKGQRVKKGDILTEGYSTANGELALGKNLLVAYMPWKGYNYEDAIVLNERVVREDILTSVHVDEYILEVRETKRGMEELTSDIPNVSEEATKDLDENGIVRVGARIEPGDILIGKITPKGESDPSPEEKLLRAIFGEKASDVRDTSLRVQPGIEGIVVDVHVFSRRGVEKDERALSIEQEEISQLAKDRDDEIAIIRRNFEARLKSMILGHKVVDAPKGISKNSTLDEEALNGIPSSQWRKIVVKDEEVMAKVEELLTAYDARLDKIQKHFEDKVEKVQRGDDLLPGVLKMVKVFIATKRKIQSGDKIAGRHGNKGTISRVLPLQDMPYMEDGTPVDIVLNPLGVPSRMNVGQILETHLGWAAKKLGEQINELWEQVKAGQKTEKELRAKLKDVYGEKQYKREIEKLSDEELDLMIPNLKRGVPMATPVFDGATGDDIHMMLEKAGLPTSGQIDLYDGRTGEKFDRKVTVGIIYMIKLHHIVDEKMHARSVGPYSLVTQQPLGGKAQFGGQRFGEMEVWALQAYGAAYTLQEMLTVKSDDVNGRTKVYESIVRGDDSFEAGIPESFNVLVKEIKSLCLNVELLNEEV